MSDVRRRLLRLLFKRWLGHECGCHHRRGAHDFAAGHCTLYGCCCQKFEPESRRELRRLEREFREVGRV